MHKEWQNIRLSYKAFAFNRVIIKNLKGRHLNIYPSEMEDWIQYYIKGNNFPERDYHAISSLLQQSTPGQFWSWISRMLHFPVPPVSPSLEGSDTKLFLLPFLTSWNILLAGHQSDETVNSQGILVVLYLGAQMATEGPGCLTFVSNAIYSALLLLKHLQSLFIIQQPSACAERNCFP